MRALATSLNIAPSTVASWKTRGSDPPAKYIVAIASFLGVSPLWLLTGEPDSLHAAPAPDSAGDEAHQELIELFDSLQRPGRTLMLAAGYKEQMRQNEQARQKLQTPTICTLGHDIISQKCST